MTEQIVQRRSRGFICVNAHPEGCRRNVERQVAAIAEHAKPMRTSLASVLVIGASTGYGLASRIADVVADHGVHLTAFERLGIPQVYAGFGEDEELRDKHGYGLTATVAAIRRAIAATHD